MNFADLGLPEPILMALAEEGYTTPTPIQAQAIPPVLTGADLLGIAQTGTGKTAAFALPILTLLAKNKRRPLRLGNRVLVLSPTRELASQIAESFRVYGKHLGITVAVVFGGVGMRPQINQMARGVDVLVATPGRLLDHVGEGTIDLSGTEILVLDEADQMLDLGFVKPIRRIVSELSQRRQNLFFSATMPKEISGLADDLLRNPVKVAVTPVATTAERVSQTVVHVEAGKKRALLVELIGKSGDGRTLVFTRTKRGADRVSQHLEAHGIGAAAIHGNKSQGQREKALAGFKEGHTRVLVATDIAARGIDVDGITHVVNYELPEVPEAYVHRIGRTARAGASGHATSLCAGDERDLLRAIEKLTRQQIPSEDRRGDANLAADADTRSGSGGSKERGRDGERGGRGGLGRSGGSAGRSSQGGGRGQGGGGRDRNGERGRDRAPPRERRDDRRDDRPAVARSAAPARSGDHRADYQPARDSDRRERREGEAPRGFTTGERPAFLTSQSRPRPQGERTGGDQERGRSHGERRSHGAPNGAGHGAQGGQDRRSDGRPAGSRGAGGERRAGQANGSGGQRPAGKPRSRPAAQR